MIRRPPRSTLFPSRRSSDLHGLQKRGSHRGRGKPREAAYLQRQKRSEEHTSELQSPCNLVCRLLLEKKKYMAEMHGLLDLLRDCRYEEQLGAARRRVRAQLR